MTDEEIENLSYNEKCSMLNFNGDKEILIADLKPIEKILYYLLD